MAKWASLSLKEAILAPSEFVFSAAEMNAGGE